MRKILLGFAAAAALCSIFTGCSSVQSYSLQSYQGPLPMNDYRFISPESYGVPTGAR